MHTIISFDTTAKKYITQHCKINFYALYLHKYVNTTHHESENTTIRHNTQNYS